ncbi:MAG TPA: hypothetical protein VL357_01685 [Rariglobus sp.]|jgi:hypothetical protein|nr:hypothetical protein [Rariglobus sp.]
MSNINPGRYTATVSKADVGESTKKGTPGVFFTFKTEDGEIDGALWLSERAYERTLNTLRECFGFNDDFASLAQQVEGRECSITVEMEADEKDPNKEWPRVKWINPIRAAAKPVAGGLLAKLTAQARTIAKPAGMPAPQPKAAPAARPAAAPKAPTGQGEIDEDVPF